jgi:type II secretory pathway pseudopilin PulG
MKSQVSGIRCQVSGGRRSLRVARRLTARAFTLIEVMVALLIFFMAVFTILALLSNTLRNARALQRKNVDAGMVAAQLSITNRISEQLEEGDFGDAYPEHNWTSDSYEVGTNGLFQVDIIVQRQGGNNPVESKMSVLLFRPESPPGRPR